MTQIDIRTISASETLALRQSVLWPQKSTKDMILPKDKAAFHFGAFDADVLIGVASFFPDDTKVRLRKMAITPAYQRHGIGKRLVLNSARHLRNLGLKTLWCDARQTAIGFYERLGFVIDPVVFDKSVLPYHRAELDLVKLP